MGIIVLMLRIQSLMGLIDGIEWELVGDPITNHVPVIQPGFFQHPRSGRGTRAPTEYRVVKCGKET